MTRLQNLFPLLEANTDKTPGAHYTPIVSLWQEMHREPSMAAGLGKIESIPKYSLGKSPVFGCAAPKIRLLPG